MSYPVGTICIGQHLVRDTNRNGQECQIVRLHPPGQYVTVSGERVEGPVYEVQWRGELFTTVISPQNLRRKDLYNQELRSDIRKGRYTKETKNVADLVAKAEAAIAAGEKV